MKQFHHAQLQPKYLKNFKLLFQKNDIQKQFNLKLYDLNEISFLKSVGCFKTDLFL